MSSLLRKAINHPERVRRRIKAALVRPFVTPPSDTVSVTNEDWDTLIILDACRFDTFQDSSPFDVPIKSVNSNSTHTTEFLKKNFSDDHLDTVYVSGTPQLAGYEDNFSQVYHVWESHWNENYRTVLPGDVTEAALDAYSSNPHKKLVVHYMQPHYPFIGEVGQSLPDHATFTGGQTSREYASVWEQLSAGKIDKKHVQQAYQENLELVVEEVKRLINYINGKTIVTSDHGNLFGRQVSRLPIKIYGHPPHLPDQELVKVPWVEFPFDERREITTSANSMTKSIEQMPEERLEDLGYI